METGLLMYKGAERNMAAKAALPLLDLWESAVWHTKASWKCPHSSRIR